MPDVIESITAHERALALPRPLRVGPLTVSDRRYTVVEVRCASGRVGTAYAQSRGAPIAEIVERLLAPAVRGRDATQIRARWEDMYRSTIAFGRVGLVIRALSLVDIALWDLLGQRAGLPVHQLLGGRTSSVPLTYVAGYPLDEADARSVIAAGQAAAARGHTRIKVARTPDRALTRHLLDGLADALPASAEIIIDANWFWRSLPEARAEIETWPVQRLGWVEDPFAPEDVDLLCALRRAVPVPVAAGDELADPTLSRRLLAAGAVDVLRIDVATIGGITAAQPLAEEAGRRRLEISFHISPETSIHLAAGLGAGGDIEIFDQAGNPFDPSHELIAGGPTYAGGAATPAEAPGLGFGVVEA
jgi:L-alanine-DL-glutamate epimerase-like enolase superfamily enzyme